MPLINPGSPAPNFTLRDAHGERHSLSDFRGRALIIYFYPEDDTPLCTSQACQFRDHHPDFSKIGCSVIGISPDDQSSHAAFIAKHNLPFALLVDEPDTKATPPGPRVSTLYGAWGEKNMYGKIIRGMLRTTYLIDSEGRVARRWDRVKTPGHAAQVLAAVKALHSGEALTTLGKPNRPSAAARKPAKKRTHAQSQTGGRASYSGVRPSKSKKTPTRAVGRKARVGAVKSRSKAR